MSLVAVPLLEWPSPMRILHMAAFSTNANNQINGAGQRLGWLFQVPRTGTIDRLGVRIHTAATPQTLRLGLYTVDSTGFPTTTLYGGSTAATFSPTANTYSSVTLGTGATATLGDMVAMVLEFDSTAGDLFWSASNGVNQTGQPSQVKFSGTWSRPLTGPALAAHVRYSDGVWGDIGCMATTAITATGSYNVNTAGADEYAIRLPVPFACRVAGLWTIFSSVSGDYEAILYDGTTALSTQAIDGEIGGLAGTVRRLMFATPVTLAAGAVVRAAIRPTATGNVTFRRNALVAAGAEEGAGYPSGSYESTRLDQGSWTDNTTNLPGIGLILDQMDDGISAGSNPYWIGG